MYTYVIKKTSYSSSSNENEVINEFRLVQHKERYTADEFFEIASQYRYDHYPYRENSANDVAYELEKNHGFIIVPEFSI
jgi:hypothetical protein